MVRKDRQDFADLEQIQLFWWGVGVEEKKGYHNIIKKLNKLKKPPKNHK